MIKKSLHILFLLLIFAVYPWQSVICDTEHKIAVLISDDPTLTTFRAQALSGNWYANFIHHPESEDSQKPVMTTSQLITEGEDGAFMLIPKGIVGQFSSEASHDLGYKRLVISGGDMLSIELPGEAPFLLQGDVEIHITDSRFQIVNKVNIHQFIVSSISLLGGSTEPEAIKAYIIMARTRLYFLKSNPQHVDQHYELDPRIDGLPFDGCGYNRELIDILANITKNQVLNHRGKLFFPRFHDTCGGKISSAKDVYGVIEPYHLAKDDLLDGTGSENCFHSPSFHWTVELGKLELLDFLSLQFAAGAERIYTSWDPIGVDKQGRVTRVILKGVRPQEVNGVEFMTNFHEYFGPNCLKSMRFNMDQLRRSIIFRGMGQGNGVGMCLFGADGLAKKGQNTAQILNFYYADSTIKK